MTNVSDYINLGVGWYILNALIFVICMIITFYSIHKLKNNRALAEKICYYVLWFVLIYKTAHYVFYCTILDHPWKQAIPCEISQMTFFIFPLTYIFGNKWFKDAGRFLGFFAGFVQLLAIVIAPYSFINSGNLNMVSFLESTIMHFLVFYAAMISMFTIEKMEWKNIWNPLLGLLIVILWGVLAANTWRFGTDQGYPNEPANIGFVQRCVLPQPVIDKFPWLVKNHLFIIPYLIAFFIMLAILYAINNYYFEKHVKKNQEPSIYGMGIYAFNKFLDKKI